MMGRIFSLLTHPHLYITEGRHHSQTLSMKAGLSNKANKEKLGIVAMVAFVLTNGEERDFYHRVRHSYLHFPVSTFLLCILSFISYFKTIGDAGDLNPGP